MVRGNRWLAAVCVATFAGMMAMGCASRDKMQAPWYYPHARMSTYTETPEEHSFRVYRVLQADKKGLAEDIDLLFQTERPTRLNRWHDR
ncbi:MAG: hypothetical protein J5J06_16745 [Phycisphaerae bacterium]|nr:hypothetical protein [Phycisphaerae bacterium]